MANFKDTVERKAFETAVNAMLSRVDKGDRCKAMTQIINLAEKFLKDTWKPEAFNELRIAFSNPDKKWMKFIDNLFDNVDRTQLKNAFMLAGYETGFKGYKQTQENSEKYDCNIPWIILMDPTSACNMHCKGCWAAEYGNKLNLSFETMDKIVTEGKALGTHAYLFTGGEPLVRKDDIIKLCRKHPDCLFHAFTNGTLITDEFAEEMREVGNFSVSISIEGFEEANDSRRGEGSFEKILKAMRILKAHKLIFGVSMCYTSKNYKVITSDEFLDLLIENGAVFGWYFHYMPVGNEASTELLLSPEQREYMVHRVREIRGWEGGKPIFVIDFQNDGEFVGGCIAAGKAYCHINPNGDVEPCVFIHYSSANINEKSLLECLQQPLFKAYRKNQPFNDNMFRPCPMLENPEYLQQMVNETGAKSTDLQSPEGCEHLCGKCVEYAKNWAAPSEELWKESLAEKQAAKMMYGSTDKN